MVIITDLEVLSTKGHRRSKHKHWSCTIAESCTVAFIINNFDDCCGSVWLNATCRSMCLSIFLLKVCPGKLLSTISNRRSTHDIEGAQSCSSQIVRWLLRLILVMRLGCRSFGWRQLRYIRRQPTATRPGCCTLEEGGRYPGAHSWRQSERPERLQRLQHPDYSRHIQRWASWRRWGQCNSVQMGEGPHFAILNHMQHHMHHRGLRGSDHHAITLHHDPSRHDIHPLRTRLLRAGQHDQSLNTILCRYSRKHIPPIRRCVQPKLFEFHHSTGAGLHFGNRILLHVECLPLQRIHAGSTRRKSRLRFVSH